MLLLQLINGTKIKKSKFTFSGNHYVIKIGSEAGFQQVLPLQVFRS